MPLNGHVGDLVYWPAINSWTTTLVLRLAFLG